MVRHLIFTVGLALAPAVATAAAPTATFLDHHHVAAAFAQGAPLHEAEGFKVHASRRDAPGEAEIHTRDTDVFYVLDGAASFVTGGSVVSPHNTGPEEIRGPEIQGGETRRIARGDVIIVPAGTPHWFESVEAPMTYYVVKVRGR